MSFGCSMLPEELAPRYASPSDCRRGLRNESFRHDHSGVHRIHADPVGAEFFRKRLRKCPRLLRRQRTYQMLRRKLCVGNGVRRAVVHFTRLCRCS
jgi:hypothetical protein